MAFKKGDCNLPTTGLVSVADDDDDDNGDDVLIKGEVTVDGFAGVLAPCKGEFTCARGASFIFMSAFGAVAVVLGCGLDTGETAETLGVEGGT